MVVFMIIHSYDCVVINPDFQANRQRESNKGFRSTFSNGYQMWDTPKERKTKKEINNKETKIKGSKAGG